MVEIEDSRQSGNLAGREDGFDIWRLLPLGSSLRPEDVVLSNERMNEEIGNRFVGDGVRQSLMFEGQNRRRRRLTFYEYMAQPFSLDDWSTRDFYLGIGLS